MKNIKNIISGNEKKILALIFILALSLRLMAAISLPERYQTPDIDAAQYDKLAVNLLAGKGFIHPDTDLPTSWWVPGYPLFLASVYSVFGHSYTAVRVIQSIMGALLCVIIFYIAKILFDSKVALLAAAALAVYQPFILYLYWGGPGFLFSENLYTLLLALLVLFLIRNLFIRFNLANSIITGALIGLIALTRSLIALFPIFLFALLVYRNKYPFIFSLKRMALLLASFILVILPWGVRNYIIHKTFVPFSTKSGFVLLGNNNLLVNGGGLATKESVNSLLTREDRDRFETMSEAEIDVMYRRYTGQFLRENYRRLPKAFFKKLLAFWDVYTTEYTPDGAIGREYNIWYSMVFIFALFGIASSIKSKLNRDILLLISLFLYFSILAMILASEPRSRYPIEPYLIIFASAGIFAIYNRFANKLLSSTIISVIIGINFLIYAYSNSILNWARQLL